MTTEEELAKLEQDGLPLGSRIWVDHYFSHFDSSSAEREAFHDALRQAGFGTPGEFLEIDAFEEISGDGYWHHSASTVFDADPVLLIDAERRAIEIAEAHGVIYEGWSVRRNELTGEVRPVDN